MAQVIQLTPDQKKKMGVKEVAYEPCDFSFDDLIAAFQPETMRDKYGRKTKSRRK